MVAFAMSAGLGVLHLVRKVNGKVPLERFLDSYRAHPAGAEHELVLLLKGFDSEADRAPFRALAGDVTDRSIAVDDSGYDIGSYLAAARDLEHQSLCMLNSFSVILADNWLQSLSTGGHAASGVGLAGATGSWGSPRTQFRYALGLGGLYAAAQADRTRMLVRLRELNAATNSTTTTTRTPRRMFRTARSMARQVLEFPPFPNHHVRTNGFVVDRDVLLQVRRSAVRNKADAWRFEAGWHSLTRQIEAMGLRAVVVGRDGRSFEREEWPRSRTLWQGEQENLLIADNQTESYRAGDAELRAVLSAFAWGLDADSVGARR
jgi:hypothetical protein